MADSYLSGEAFGGVRGDGLEPLVYGLMFLVCGLARLAVERLRISDWYSTLIFLISALIARGVIGIVRARVGAHENHSVALSFHRKWMFGLSFLVLGVGIGVFGEYPSTFTEARSYVGPILVGLSTLLFFANATRRTWTAFRWIWFSLAIMAICLYLGATIGSVSLLTAGIGAILAIWGESRIRIGRV
jgi:hypothetical protein